MTSHFGALCDHEEPKLVTLRGLGNCSAILALMRMSRI